MNLLKNGDAKQSTSTAQMTGSLVKMRFKPARSPFSAGTRDDRIGIITDSMEMEDGFFEYEIVFPDERGWFNNLQFEVINES